MATNTKTTTIKLAFYKANGKGVNWVYHKGVKFWTQSKYSHVEVVFSDGMSASSSFQDGGVRFKDIKYTEGNWDFVEIQTTKEADIRAWFELRVLEGAKYDLLGNVYFILPFIKDTANRYSCAESIAAAGGYNEAFRFNPGVLYAVVTSKNNILF